MMYTYKIETNDGTDIEVNAHRMLAADGFVKFYVYDANNLMSQSHKVAMFPASRINAAYAIDGDQ